MLLPGSLKVALILAQIITKKVIMMGEIPPRTSVRNRKGSKYVNRIKKSVNSKEELRKKPEKERKIKLKKREKIG